ncbi:MAG: DUF4145 domain-containing protein [Spirochaetia bacterium]
MTASAAHHGGYISDYFPKVEQIDSEIPGNAREYLRQAIESIHAPAAAVLLAASAIDSMLKEKGYKEGHLKPRIDQAQKDNVITLEMAKWAHQVRLDANDPRHADEAKPLPNEEDARLSIEFAKALGTFMFTLPARVTRGIKDSEPK